MDRTELFQQLSATHADAVVDQSRFGRTADECVWIDSRRIADVARFCADHGWDWLENLSSMQVEDALVLTYFVRERAAAALAILRVSIEMASPDAPVSANSVAGAWPMALPMEDEISELFGAHFAPGGRKPDPAAWSGFPLRKGFTLGT